MKPTVKIHGFVGGAGYESCLRTTKAFPEKIYACHADSDSPEINTRWMQLVSGQVANVHCGIPCTTWSAHGTMHGGTGRPSLPLASTCSSKNAESDPKLDPWQFYDQELRAAVEAFVEHEDQETPLGMKSKM